MDQKKNGDREKIDWTQRSHGRGVEDPFLMLAKRQTENDISFDRFFAVKQCWTCKNRMAEAFMISKEVINFNLKLRQRATKKNTGKLIFK